MNEYVFVRLMFGLLCLTVLFIVMIDLLKHHKNQKQKNAFLYVMLSTAFTILVNEVFAMIYLHYYTVTLLTFKVVVTCAYFGPLCVCHAWYCFAKTQIHSDFLNTRWLKTFISFLFIINLTAISSSIRTGLIFAIDENYNYTYGPLWQLNALCNLIFVLIPLLVSFVKIANSNSDENRQKYFSIGSIAVFPIIFQAIYEIVFNKLNIVLPIQSFGGVISVILAYLVVLQSSRQKEQQKLFNITNALSLDYGSVFYVNTVNDEYTIMRLDDFMKDYYQQIFAEKILYDEIIEYCAKNMIYSEDKDNFSNFLQIPTVKDLLSSRDSYSFDFRGKNTEVYHYVRIKLFKTDSEINHFIIGVKDITAEVGKQQQYHEDLQNALIEARSANKAKNIFLSNMSHDIRTPMNAIVGFTDIARRSITDTDKVSECLEKIESSSNHLLSLINDILDMSRIENGKMILENIPTSLSSLLKEIQDIIYPDVSNKNIHFEIKKTDIKHDNLYLDPMRVKQVFLNLLSNAMKFTQIGGKVSFEIVERQSLNPEFASFHCVISDNGCGMSSEFVKKIFEPFARERSTTDSGISGTGLGMSIVKNIVQKLKGNISVLSREGQGTDFILDVSFKICTEVPVPELCEHEKEPPKEQSLEGIKILLVEDNELNREIAKNILVRNNAQVTELINCRQALDLLTVSKPGDFDLVLMDIQTPFMNGYDATRAIRNQVNNPIHTIPIIAMTANAFEEDKRLALDAGMDAHVSKPINVSVLLDTIVKVINKD